MSTGIAQVSPTQLAVAPVKPEAPSVAASNCDAAGQGETQGSAFSSQLKEAVADTGNSTSEAQKGPSKLKDGNGETVKDGSLDPAVVSEILGTVAQQLLAQIQAAAGAQQIIQLSVEQAVKGNEVTPSVGQTTGSALTQVVAGAGNAGKNAEPGDKGKMPVPAELLSAAQDDSAVTITLPEQKAPKASAAMLQNKIIQALQGQTSGAANQEIEGLQVLPLHEGKGQPLPFTKVEPEAAGQVASIKVSESDGGKASSSGNNNALMSSTAQSQQTTPTKQEFTVKEPVHVSRLQELGETVAKALESGSKSITIKLDPPDLGGIQIRLRMENGVLTANFKVDSSSVKDIFSQAMPHIKTSLEGSGIKSGDFNVDVRQDGYSQGKKQQEQDSGRQQTRQNKEPEEQFFNFFA
jgi:flagellar hook-length control protein FliK